MCVLAPWKLSLADHLKRRYRSHNKWLHFPNEYILAHPVARSPPCCLPPFSFFSHTYIKRCCADGSAFKTLDYSWCHSNPAVWIGSWRGGGGGGVSHQKTFAIYKRCRCVSSLKWCHRRYERGCAAVVDVCMFGCKRVEQREPLKVFVCYLICSFACLFCCNGALQVITVGGRIWVNGDTDNTFRWRQQTKLKYV